jgi:RNA polymerase sigma factor (sigma-70 family)
MAAVPAQGRATAIEPHAAPATEAAAGLCERHYAKVLAYCRRRLRSREDAEDAAQTTFLYAHRSLQRGVVPIVEEPWLLRIAQNVCVARWRANGRRTKLEASEDPQVLEEVAAETDPADFTAEELKTALSQLTENQRRAILMREWQGQSYAEIAAELGVSVSAVETLLFRSRRSLANELTKSRRLRDGANLGTLFGWVKSLFGGPAAKLAAAAALAVTALAGGTVALNLRSGHVRPRGVPSAFVRGETPVGAGPVSRARSRRAKTSSRRHARHAVAPGKTAPASQPTPGAPNLRSQPASTTPGTVTPSLPSVTVPAPSVPSVSHVPTVGIPSVTVPATPSLPPVTVPSVTVPSVSVPGVTTPVVTTPTVSVPTISVPKLP